MVEELQKSGSDFKVLYMSGFTDGLLEDHGSIREARHFLPKPFTREHFVQKVREVLDEVELCAAS